MPWVVLLLLCFAYPVINGSHRWIKLGVQFQPSELAKIIGVMVVAAWCAERAEARKTFLQGFLYPMGIVGAMIIAIALEIDLGNAMLLTFASLSVLYAGGTRLRYLGTLVLSAGAALTLAITLLPERMARVMAFMDLEKYRSGDGLQQWLGLMAFGSGGPTGVGLGNSRQKMWSLPYANSDMISSVIGEELGGWFCIFLVGCYVTMVVAGFFIAIHAPDRFGSCLASVWSV